LVSETSQQALRERAKRRGSELLLREAEEHQGRMEVIHRLINVKTERTAMAVIKKSSSS